MLDCINGRFADTNSATTLSSDRMTQLDYFGKSKTGGSNASYGFSYQDHCAMLFLLKYYDDPAFEGLGIETDDDFCLLFGQRKVACQVKYETLTGARPGTACGGRADCTWRSAPSLHRLGQLPIRILPHGVRCQKRSRVYHWQGGS